MFSLPLARQRHDLNRALRRFFDDRGYLEIDTPVLTAASIPESTIPLFATRLRHPFQGDLHLQLLPSPEYYLKQLLARGFGKLMSLGPAFRDGEQLGHIHSPEFTMLEYYTPGFDYHQSLQLTQDLVTVLAQPLGVSWPAWRTISLAEAFQTWADIDLAAMTEPVDDHEALERARAAGTQADVSWQPNDDWGTIFNRILLNRVEPNLGDGPVVLIDYPWRIPTLAKRQTDAQGRPRPWVERWELYCRGIEIANCFTEETDPERVRAFFAGEIAAMAAAEGSTPPWATDFDQISARLGQCSGVALGWDRLLMVLLKQPHIAAVRAFTLHGDDIHQS